MGKADESIMTILKKKWSYGFIVFIWLLFAFPYFFKGLIPFPSTYLVSFFPPWSAYYGMPVKNSAMPDIITQIFPWKHLTIESWKQAEIPLWNPYSFSGTVQAANYQSAVFSPINLLFFILPFVHAWSISVLLQPLVAGLCMCLFLRLIKRSHFAAVIGSTAFMFCGFITTWMGYETLGWSIAVLPLALIAVHQFVNTKFWWPGPLLSVSIAFSLLSGHYQISFYLVLTVSLFILSYVSAKKDQFLLFIFLVLGIGLALPQLSITFSALLQSNRNESFTHGAIPWSYLITLFAPDFYGNPVTRNDWFGQYAEWSSYVGVVPFFLALFTLGGGWVKEKKIFLLLLIISLLFALTTPINTFLYQSHIPIISTSVATRMIVLVSFSFAVLSAFGVDDLIDEWQKKKKRRIYITVTLAGLLLAVLWGCLQVLKVVSPDQLTIAKHNSIFPTGLLLGAFAVMILGTVFKKMRLLLLFFLLLITSFDLYRYSSKWMPFESKQYIYPELPVITYLRKTVGNDRLYGTFGNELDTYYALPTLEGYDAIYQARYGEFISSAQNGKIESLERSVVQLNKGGNYSEEILQLLGTKYLLHRISDGHNVWAYPFWLYANYMLRYRDEKYEVYENTASFPRAFLASSYSLQTDKQQIIDTLFSNNFNRKKSIILEKKPEFEPVEGSGQVKFLSYQPTKIILTVESQTPQLLFLSDVFDSGWKALINGKPTAVLRADYAFRAISVPPGNSTIEFRYQPSSFMIGLVGSLTSVFVLFFLSVRKLRV